MICFCFNLNSILKFISLLIGSEGGISSLLTMNTSYWGREKAHALTICWILLPVSFFFSVILSLAINESPLSFASRIHYWVHLKDVMRSYMYKWCQRRWAALRFLPGKLKRTKYRWSAYYINKSVGCLLSCLSALGWEYTKGRSKLLCLLTRGGWKKITIHPIDCNYNRQEKILLKLRLMNHWVHLGYTHGYGWGVTCRNSDD